MFGWWPCYATPRRTLGSRLLRCRSCGVPRRPVLPRCILVPKVAKSAAADFFASLLVRPQRWRGVLRRRPNAPHSLVPSSKWCKVVYIAQISSVLFLEPPSRLHRYQFQLHFERCHEQLMYMHKHQIYMLSKSVSVINQKWLFQCSLAYSNQGRIQHRGGRGSSPRYRRRMHRAPPKQLL